MTSLLRLCLVYINKNRLRKTLYIETGTLIPMTISIFNNVTARIVKSVRLYLETITTNQLITFQMFTRFSPLILTGVAHYKRLFMKLRLCLMMITLKHTMRIPFEVKVTWKEVANYIDKIGFYIFPCGYVA